MMNHQSRSDNRSTRSTNIALTAAMLAMLAGAPAGYAQTSTEDSPDSGRLGSLMSFLGGGDQGAAQPEEGDQFRTDGVYYDDNMTVELHVQDEELTDVLQMLSLQSERNIVASNDVSARVTANLYGVTFHEALDAILHVNGYGYVEKGNFIYVYPAEVLTEIEQASRQIEGHVFRLSFLNAVDAADFVTPLLSESGEIKSNGKIGAWTDPKEPTGNEEFASESTIIVYDFPENIESIGHMLEQLDTRPAQILVEATIVQTALNEANAFGVDFSIIADFDYADFVSPLGAVDALVRGGDGSGRVPADGGATGAVSTPGNISGPGTFKAGIVSNDVTVFLRMLNEVTSTTIISNPKVVTLNRQPGRVLVGRKVGYLQTTSTDTSTTQSVEFLDTGTQLNFRPFVTGDGIIRMELKPQVSEAQLRSATDATGAAVTIPDEVTNELTANVMVPDGHTIVLGGLFREATTATRRQVPVLGDIPILGTAFRGHDDDIQRQEIIFMITPSIISDQVLVTQGLRGEDAVRRVRAGAREGTLPFSQSRQAAQLLVEAEQLAAEGETDTALHKVRRALALVPANTQAIELREKLVNEKDIWPTNSVLEEIISGDAENAMEHNILQHGWKGPTSDRETGRSDPQRENAPRHAAANGGRAAGQGGANSWQGSATSSQRSGDAFGDAVLHAPIPDQGTWWTSPEFDVFMTFWSVQSALEQGREFEASDRWWASEQFQSFARAYDAGAMPASGDAWWISPEFDSFMLTWAAASAQERGQVFDPADRWWRGEQFAGFVSASLHDTDAAAGARDDPAGAWWTSADFTEFLRVWSVEAARERGQGPAGADQWWTSPEFSEFMQVFNNATVSEANAQHGGDTPATHHASSSHDQTSTSGYTEVPGDNED